MTYEGISYFAQTWGLVYLVAMFAVVLVYVCWPGNRKKFKDAARIPFKED
jgi:cytochrome c oxidase cbb3-type subunit 4